MTHRCFVQLIIFSFVRIYMDYFSSVNNMTINNFADLFVFLFSWCQPSIVSLHPKFSEKLCLSISALNTFKLVMCSTYVMKPSNPVMPLHAVISLLCSNCAVFFLFVNVLLSLHFLFLYRLQIFGIPNNHSH